MQHLHGGVTIRDVARRAGVSVSTVSRVLNDKDDVASETAATVRRVIEELGYASSIAARSLRSRTTNVVGLIVPDLWHPFTSLVIRGVNQITAAQGYDLLAYAGARRNPNSVAHWEVQLVAQLNGTVTDGIIVVTPNAATYRTASPLVAIDPVPGDHRVSGGDRDQLPGGARGDDLSGQPGTSPHRLHCRAP
jgi:LacI family transcriptional regulator